MKTDKNYKGFTPLMLASERDYVSTIELLLKNGADITAQSNENESSLMLAEKYKNSKAIKVLEAHGAR